VAAPTGQHLSQSPDQPWDQSVGVQARSRARI
jgi:hypothetical protein